MLRPLTALLLCAGLVACTSDPAKPESAVAGNTPASICGLLLAQEPGSLPGLADVELSVTEDTESSCGLDNGKEGASKRGAGLTVTPGREVAEGVAEQAEEFATGSDDETMRSSGITIAERFRRLARDKTDAQVCAQFLEDERDRGTAFKHGVALNTTRFGTITMYRATACRGDNVVTVVVVASTTADGASSAVVHDWSARLIDSLPS